MIIHIVRTGFFLVSFLSLNLYVSASGDVLSNVISGDKYDIKSEEDLLKLATSGYDHDIAMHKHTSIDYKGVRLEIAFPCSDLCPQYTRRIIFYGLWSDNLLIDSLSISERQIESEKKCRNLGGVIKSIAVPMGIAMAHRPFCVPKILADNWSSIVW